MLRAIFVENYTEILKVQHKLKGRSCRVIGGLINKPGSDETYSGQAINETLVGNNKNPYLIREIAKVLECEDQIMKDKI